MDNNQCTHFQNPTECNYEDCINFPRKKIILKVCCSCGGQLSRMDIKENSCFTEHKEVITNESVCKFCNRGETGIDQDVWIATCEALHENGDDNLLRTALYDQDMDKRMDAQYKIRKYVLFASALLELCKHEWGEFETCGQLYQMCKKCKLTLLDGSKLPSYLLQKS